MPFDILSGFTEGAGKSATDIVGGGFNLLSDFTREDPLTKTSKFDETMKTLQPILAMSAAAQDTRRANYGLGASATSKFLKWWESGQASKAKYALEQDKLATSLSKSNQSKKATSLNAISDDWTKLVTAEDKPPKDFVGEYSALMQRAKDEGLQNSNFVKESRTQFVSQIAERYSPEEVTEDMKKSGIFKNDKKLYSEVKNAVLEKNILDKKHGGFAGIGGMTVDRDGLKVAFKNYIATTGKSPKNVAEANKLYMDFLEGVNDKKISLPNLLEE